MSGTRLAESGDEMRFAESQPAEGIQGLVGTHFSGRNLLLPRL